MLQVVRERRHTLAEVHNNGYEGDGDQMRTTFVHDVHGGPVASGGPAKLSVPNGVKKKTSFSGFHARLNKQLSDVAEIVNGPGMPVVADTQGCLVLFCNC